eukprot:EG_transcript_15563
MQRAIEKLHSAAVWPPVVEKSSRRIKPRPGAAQATQRAGPPTTAGCRRGTTLRLPAVAQQRDPDVQPARGAARSGRGGGRSVRDSPPPTPQEVGVGPMRARGGIGGGRRLGSVGVGGSTAGRQTTDVVELQGGQGRAGGWDGALWGM